MLYGSVSAMGILIINGKSSFALSDALLERRMQIFGQICHCLNAVKFEEKQVY